MFKDPSPSHNSFRRQYEQLQTVIVRVLRPAAPTSGSGQPVSGATTPTEQGEAGMETDDMSAVREVRLAYENVKVVDCLDLTPEGNASWEAALKRYVHLYTLQTSVTHKLLLFEDFPVWYVGTIRIHCSLHMCTCT